MKFSGLQEEKLIESSTVGATKRGVTVNARMIA